MAAHIQRGLLWEILDYRMEEEEPDAYAIIQEALNSKNSAALVVHEMEHLNGLANTIVDIGARMAERFDWKILRDKLLQSGSTVIAEAPEFVSLVQVVTTALGGNASGQGGYNHWTEMKEFHEAMVNPKVRRCRLHTIAQLCHIPERHARNRNALFRTMFTGPAATAEQIKSGQVFLKTVGSLSHLEHADWGRVLDMTECVLERWHITYEGLGAFMGMTILDSASLVGPGRAQACGAAPENSQ